MLSRRGIFSLPALGALAVLVVNDHLLKALVPGLVTGKLSDFAGLFLAPVVVAAPFGRRARPVAHAAAVLGAVAFALAKLVPAIAAFVSAHVMLTTCDPTDLVAVPMLWLGARHAAGVADARPELHRWAERLALALAAFGSIATSAQPPPRGPEPPPPPPKCASVTPLGTEVHPGEAKLWYRLQSLSSTGAACEVTLLAKIATTPSPRMTSEIRGRATPVTVGPGRSMDVWVSLPTPYPVECATTPTETEVLEHLDGDPVQTVPSETIPHQGCTTSTALVQP